MGADERANLPRYDVYTLITLFFIFDLIVCFHLTSWVRGIKTKINDGYNLYRISVGTTLKDLDPVSIQDGTVG